MSDNFFIRFLNDPLGTIGSFFKGTGELSGAWSFIKGLFTVLDVILVVIFILVFFVALKYRPRLHPKYGAVKRLVTVRDIQFQERWQAILNKSAAGTVDAFKIAIIEADKLADDVLKRLGLGGDHMADRLEKLFPQELRSIDKIWRAHRVRNNIVHNPDYVLRREEGQEALRGYEAFLKEVKVL